MVQIKAPELKPVRGGGDEVSARSPKSPNYFVILLFLVGVGSNSFKGLPEQLGKKPCNLPEHNGSIEQSHLALRVGLPNCRGIESGRLLLCCCRNQSIWESNLRGMSMTLEEFASRLKGAKLAPGGNYRKYRACCPAHVDTSPSFAVWEKDVWLHVKCQAGCPESAILASMGLSTEDRRITPKQDSGSEVVYTYRDADGNYLFEKVRVSGEKKKILQRVRKSDGTFTLNLSEVKGPRPLYRLSEIRHGIETGHAVYVCEGEKACDKLFNLGLHATCQSAGAGPGKWQDHHTEQLRGASSVLIVADRDQVGSDYARGVFEKLSAAGLVCTVVRSKTTGEHDDAYDHFAFGYSVNEFDMAEDLMFPVPSNSHLLTSSYIESEKVRNEVLSMAELLSRPDEEFDWVVDGMLPSGGLSLLVAKPKVGKSTMARNLALCVSRGESFLGRCCTKGPVIYLALEEKQSEVKRHFALMGADEHDSVFSCFGSIDGDPLALLLELLEKFKPSLVIIDPLFLFVRVRDGNDYAEVTRVLEPLRTLARKCGAHFLLVHHMGKGAGEDGDGVLGSTALFGAVDCLIEYRKRSTGRTVKNIPRYGELLEETVIELDDSTGRISGGSTVEVERRRHIAKAVRDELANGGLPESTLKDRVEGNNNLIQSVLREMVSGDEIIRIGSGRKGDPFIYAIQGLIGNGELFGSAPAHEEN